MPTRLSVEECLTLFQSQHSMPCFIIDWFKIDLATCSVQLI